MQLHGVVIGGEEVAAKFSAMPETLQSKLRKAINKSTIAVQRLSKEKLDGEVLKVRTGRLRRSITQRVTEAAGNVTGIVGTNVEYAHVHEYGFTGTVTVKEHLRRTKSGFMASVRSHERHMNLPERSFLRSALKELGEQITENINEAVKETLAE